MSRPRISIPLNRSSNPSSACAILAKSQIFLAIWSTSLKERQHQKSELIRMWTAVIVRVIFLLAGLVVACWLIFEIRTLLLLLILSVFFCYLIAPIVHLLEQPVYVARIEIRLPRSLAIVIVYGLIAVALFGVVQLIWPPLSQQVT